MTRTPAYGTGLAALGALILTPDTLFMRWSEMDGATMLAWRGLLGGSLLILAWLVTARRSRRAGLRALRHPTGLAVMLCHGLNAALFSLSIAVAPVAIVLFGVACVPICAAVIARLGFGERTPRGTWPATIAVLAGIGLSVFGHRGEAIALDTRALLGALGGLGVAASMATSFVLIRNTRALPILPAIGTGSLAAGLCGFAIVGPAAMGQGTVWAIVISAAVLLPVSFLMLTSATRHVSATTVSLLLLLETVLGPVWVWIGAGEAMTRSEILGGAIVIASLGLYIIFAERESEGVSPAT